VRIPKRLVIDFGDRNSPGDGSTTYASARQIGEIEDDRFAAFVTETPPLARAQRAVGSTGRVVQRRHVDVPPSFGRRRTNAGFRTRDSSVSAAG
jgi:hypothetical protein